MHPEQKIKLTNSQALRNDCIVDSENEYFVGLLVDGK